MTKQNKKITKQYCIVMLIVYIISIVPDFFIVNVEETLTRTFVFIISVTLLYVLAALEIKYNWLW